MTKDMTTGPITPLLVNFTVPLVLGNLFQLTYNAVDSIIVGKFVGEDALAAVGTSNPLMTLAILFINGVCLGAGILVSTAFGAGDTRLVERQVSTTAIAGSVFSLVFSLTCVILANPLLRLLQVPEEILPIAVNYLRIVFGGLLFTFFYNFLAATMRALGDSKSALYFLMISSVLNIGGDLFFVEVLDWGSEGCALSTVLSEALCRPLCAAFVGYSPDLMQLTVHGFRLFALCYLFCGVNIYASAFFTALCNGALSAFISFLRSLLLRGGLVLLLPPVLGLDGVWLAVVAAEGLSAAVSAALLWRQRTRYHYL